MHPKQFLMLGGIILLALGLLGFIGFRLGDALYFDSAENWAHTVLGIVAIAASYVLGESAQRSLVWVVGVVAVFFGIYGFISPTFDGAHLEFLDNIVHLAVAVWAYLAVRGKSPATA